MTSKDSSDEEIIEVLLPSVQRHPERIARLEYAVLLLAKHVGATGWNRELQEVLDAIEAEPDFLSFEPLDRDKGQIK